MYMCVRAGLWLSDLFVRPCTTPFTRASKAPSSAPLAFPIHLHYTPAFASTHWHTGASLTAPGCCTTRAQNRKEIQAPGAEALSKDAPRVVCPLWPYVLHKAARRLHVCPTRSNEARQLESCTEVSICRCKISICRAECG